MTKRRIMSCVALNEEMARQADLGDGKFNLKAFMEVYQHLTQHSNKRFTRESIRAVAESICQNKEYANVVDLLEIEVK